MMHFSQCFWDVFVACRTNCPIIIFFTHDNFGPGNAAPAPWRRSGDTLESTGTCFGNALGMSWGCPRDS